MTSRPGVIALVVADMSAATGFYERLGLTFSETAPGHAEAELGGESRLDGNGIDLYAVLER